jgi:site-specific recombinase XerD
MTDDMRKRNFRPKTQAAYLRGVAKLCAFLKRSPDTATVDDLRRFQLHLVDDGTSPITLNATISGLKFFFDITLNHPELMAKMPRSSQAEQSNRSRTRGTTSSTGVSKIGKSRTRLV